MPYRHEFETEEAFLAALRDWFAGQSISGCARSSDAPGYASSRAYRVADEMMAERAE